MAIGARQWRVLLGKARSPSGAAERVAYQATLHAMNDWDAVAGMYGSVGTGWGLQFDGDN